MKGIVCFLLMFGMSVFGYVTVTSPNGGEVITRGGTFEVTWSDDISEDVKIELFKGSVFNSEISSATSSDGSFVWTIPTSLFGDDFQVKISSTVMPVLHSDLSDSYFTIERETGVIEILYPDGGEI